MKLKKLLFIIFIFILSVSAFAKHKIEIRDNVNIYINKNKVVVFRCNALDQTPEARASLMFFELFNLAQNNLLTDNFSIIPKSEETPYATILINGDPITIITDEDAKFLNSTPDGLAKVWVNNIRQALLKQSIYMTEAQGVIPINEKRVKNLYGYDLTNVKFNIENPEIATVKYNEDTQTFEIFGKNLGTTDITISNNFDQITYTIYVQKYAAVFPTQIEAQVTGNPISADFVSQAMTKNINKGIATEPGATYKVNYVNWNKKPLYPGNETGAEVNITAYGEGYITITKSVRFVIKNIVMEQGVPDTLLYSNNPETVEEFGDLYLGTLEKGKCQRLLYHHMNQVGRNAILVIEVINPNNEAVNLRVRRSAAKPQLDTIAIGVVTAKEFMNLDDKNVSVIDTIPPKSRSCYLTDDLKNGISSSGIMQFWQLDGEENCVLRIRMVPPEDIDCILNKYKPYTGNGNFEFSDYVFSSPILEFNEEYKIGGPWVFMSIGKAHLQNEKHLKLYGNYGVTYNMNVTVENPTDKVATVRAYVDPTAGPLAAYIKINNNYITIHHVKPPNEYELAQWKLAPGERKKVTIKTIPVSGSCYPAKICIGQKL